MASFLLAVITLSVPFAGASLSTMRRETRKSLSLTSAGALLEVHSHNHQRSQPQGFTKISGNDEVVGNDQITDEANEDSAIDFCNYDFPLGNDLTNNCSSAKHERILDMGECRQAAVQAGARTTENFELTYDWYNKHPAGCFIEKCAEGSDETCYFYNPSPTVPDDIIKGTPVCKRPKLLNGTANTNGECPTGYQPVTNEDRCMEFATCLTHCVGTQFRINLMNASVYNLYPKWCFIHPDDSCVYFNEPRQGMGNPTSPEGIPICNVSTITHFPPAIS